MKFFWTPDVQRAVLGASFSELRLGTRADSRRTAGGFAPAHRTARAVWLLFLARETPDAEPNSTTLSTIRATARLHPSRSGMSEDGATGAS